ncbi:MAG: tetratricopeptide repeat protein [Cyanothece sp. SIO1E1]|nr:tetratricopeptide repeat protein [Cyanothece sp. SIO1E1]
MIKGLSTYLVAVLLLFVSNEDIKKGNEAYDNADYAQAEELYRAALESDPDNAQVYFNLGNALAKQGKVEEAIQMYLQYESMVESPEEKAQAEYNIGTVLSEGQQWKPALQHLRNSLKFNPTDSEAQHNFERALAESQKEDEEQQQQDQNQEQEPPTEYAKAMKKRAEELVSQERYQEAFQLMQQALQVDQTVQNYNQFINRIGAVSEIDS